MAALKIKEDSSNALVLDTSLAQRVSNLGSVFGLAVLLCVCSSSIFSNSRSTDPVQLIFALIALFFVLRAVYALLGTTTVAIDSTLRVASRSSSLFGIPLRRAELPFDRVKQIALNARARTSRNASLGNFWSVQLDPDEGAPLVVNTNGSHAEMAALADKLSGILRKPISDPIPTEAPGAATIPEFRPIENFGGGGTPSYAPPVAAPSLFGGRAPASQLPEKQPEPNTFAPDSLAPDHAQFEDDARTRELRDEVVSADLASASTPTRTEISTSEGTNPLGSTSLYSSQPAMDLPDQPALGGTGDQTTAPSTPNIVAAPSARIAPPRRRSYDELKQALAQDPTDSEASYQLARILHSRGLFADAENYYQSAVRYDPLNSSAQNDLGVLNLQRGKFKEAETALRRAIGLDPFSEAAHYNLGLVLARTGRRNEAVQEFKRAADNASSDNARQLYTSAANGNLAGPILSQ